VYTLQLIQAYNSELTNHWRERGNNREALRGNVSVTESTGFESGPCHSCIFLLFKELELGFISLTSVQGVKLTTHLCLMPR